MNLFAINFMIVTMGAGIILAFMLVLEIIHDRTQRWSEQTNDVVRAILVTLLLVGVAGVLTLAAKLEDASFYVSSH